jgi:hypothetical protein
VPFVIVIIQSSLPLSQAITGVTCVERGSDDWIITTTNGTHVTPVIDRERGSDDWIITTTNGTHVTSVIDRERGSDEVTCVPFVVVIIQSSLPLSRSITGVTCVPFVVVMIQSSLYNYDKRNIPVIGRERGSDDWIITTTNGTHVTPVIGRASHHFLFQDLSPE